MCVLQYTGYFDAKIAAKMCNKSFLIVLAAFLQKHILMLRTISVQCFLLCRIFIFSFLFKSNSLIVSYSIFGF